MASPARSNRSILSAAREALERGYQPTPIRLGSKAPKLAGWTHRIIDADSVEEVFKDAAGVGLRLGEVSGGLVDVDLDDPLAFRLRHLFLPETRMRTGRPGSPESHFWYRVEDDLPGYRKYALPGGSTIIELRPDGGHQTVIPPSTWYPKNWDGNQRLTEKYRWEGDPWGGADGPAVVSGRRLALRVAALALVAILIENWPEEGSRHDAYLALAGGLLRFGDKVHPFWAQVLPQIIEGIAEATHDKDGPQTRVSEVISTTENRLVQGIPVQGWNTLKGILGDETVKRAMSVVRDIDDLANWRSHEDLLGVAEALPEFEDATSEHDGEEGEEKSDEPRNPLDDRVHTWEVVPLDQYLDGSIKVPDPTVLTREDDQGIFYPGRVNSMYGRSESAKSWVAVYCCIQQMAVGARVLYIDLEDDPAMIVERLMAMGAGVEDIKAQFSYVRPESALPSMHRDSYGNEKSSEKTRASENAFKAMLNRVGPSLIIVDGMSVLYGLHGLNTNDVASTDVITNWLKSLCRNGRSTVIVIDHTGKGAEKGASPIGSQHKISMVQGSAIQVVPVKQPKPGALGHVELVIGKDRPGKVRKIATDDKHAVVADVYLDSTKEGETIVSVKVPDPNAVVIDASKVPPEPKKKPSQHLQDELVKLFQSNIEVRYTKAGARRTLISQGYEYNGFSDSTVNRIFDEMQRMDIIRSEGKGVRNDATKYYAPAENASEEARRKWVDETGGEVKDAE